MEYYDKIVTEKDDYLLLSLVIPLFNESGNVSVLLDALRDNLDCVNGSYEIILVDDGSTDNTWEKIQEQSLLCDKLIGLRLARNFGHQHALLAGLNHSKGELVISMDGDLQHPPSLIKELVEKSRDGFLVVNTIRHDKEVSSLFKRTTSKIFYKIFSSLCNVRMTAGSSDFRLLHRTVVDHLLELRDVDIFLRGAVEWLGFPSTNIPYKANKRFSGETKYSLSKMIRFAKGSIISFSTKPLIIGVWLGGMTSVLAFLELIYILFQVALGETVPGWASTVGIISFLFGILFIILGIIGTYLARIHVALQNRPRYLISEIQKTKASK